MRTAFIQELIRQARTNPRLFLVVGDLGYSVVELFAEEFPDRFLNAGVAEQNMTGVAAGLAAEGFHVFTYSIANFPTLRCLEQIRNDICYHRLPVTVTSVGAGFAYGNLGYSHHAVEDIGIMRTLPNLTVLSPADPGETESCVRWLSANPRPSYLRIGKAGERRLHAVWADPFTGPLCLRSSTGSVAVVACGSVLELALHAADVAQRDHAVSTAVYSCPLLSPIGQAFFDPLWNYRRIVVVQEHTRPGGLGELIAALTPPTTSVVVHAPEFCEGLPVGSQNFLRMAGGLTVQGVASSIANAL